MNGTKQTSPRADRTTDAVIVLHNGCFRELTGPMATEILQLWNQRPNEERIGETRPAGAAANGGVE